MLTFCQYQKVVFHPVAWHEEGLGDDSSAPRSAYVRFLLFFDRDLSTGAFGYLFPFPAFETCRSFFFSPYHSLAFGFVFRRTPCTRYVSQGSRLSGQAYLGKNALLSVIINQPVLFPVPPPPLITRQQEALRSHYAWWEVRDQSHEALAQVPFPLRLSTSPHPSPSYKAFSVIPGGSANDTPMQQAHEPLPVMASTMSTPLTSTPQPMIIPYALVPPFLRNSTLAHMSSYSAHYTLHHVDTISATTSHSTLSSALRMEDMPSPTLSMRLEEYIPPSPPSLA